MRLLLLLLLILPGGLRAAEPEYPQLGPDLYDPTADGSALIAAALEAARQEQHHVLLVFGANWCGWCRRLHHTFETEPAVAERLRQGYEVVLIDVNQRKGEKRNAAVNARYGNPIQHGLPVLVVLDETGAILTTQETGALEAGGAHDPAKVTAFLAKWAPPAAAPRR